MYCTHYLCCDVTSGGADVFGIEAELPLTMKIVRDQGVSRKRSEVGL